MHRRLLRALVALVAIWLTGVPFCPASDGTENAPMLLGGPCAYDAYPGKAVILAVSPEPRDADTTRGPATPYPGYAVTYRFTPDAPITGQPLYRPGEVRTLTLVNDMAPGPRFLQKYAIAPGRTFPCQLRVIRQGTCTPALYAFPTIDLSDYFELGSPGKGEP